MNPCNKKPKPLKNWSKLPQQILLKISKHLINQNQNQSFINFRCVCRSWRRSTTVSSLLSCTSLHQILSSTTVYLIRHPSSAPFILTAVKPTKGSTQFIHPFTGNPFHNLPENFNFRRFDYRKLSVCFRVENGKGVVFSSGSFLVSEISDLFVLKLNNCGELGFFRCSGLFSGLSYGNVDRFDDLVMFNGVKCVLDQLGRLYQVDYCKVNDEVNVVKTLVDVSVSKGSKNRCRKRLVVSSDNELYLVERVISQSESLRVHKLSHGGKKWVWVKAEGFGNDVMFVTKDHCFFVAIDEFPRRQVPKNCIVFTRDAFPRYSTTGWEFPVEANSQKDIYVFHLCRGTAKRRHFLFTVQSVMWLPPPSISHSDLLREFGKDEKGQFDLNSKEEDEDSQPNSNSQERRTAGTYDASNVAREDIPEEKVTHSTSGIPSTSEVPSGIPSTSEACEICSTKMKFQGIDIKPNLLPTLEIITAKHGNLIGEDTVRSKVILASILELLVNMVITLQNSTGRTLTNAVAEELRSNLSDLQCVGLKVDWLVPLVDKVWTIQKSKPLLDSLMALDKAKAEVDEKERELLARIAKRKQELEESRADLSARIPLTEPVDLDECLGVGIC